jgi:histidine triad (HIT) family protein
VVSASTASGRERDPSCIFCRIVAGEIPSTKVAEDDAAVAFRDIAPKAPTHVLVVSREHIPSAAELTDTDGPLLGRMFAMIAAIARDEGIDERGYRIVTNVGQWGGQSVDHLHFHLLGGRQLSWPSG